MKETPRVLLFKTHPPPKKKIFDRIELKKKSKNLGLGILTFPGAIGIVVKHIQKG